MAHRQPKHSKAVYNPHQAAFYSSGKRETEVITSGTVLSFTVTMGDINSWMYHLHDKVIHLPCSFAYVWVALMDDVGLQWCKSWAWFNFLMNDCCVGLGDMRRVKHHTIIDQIPQYRLFLTILGRLLVLSSVMAKWISSEYYIFTVM